MRHFATSLVVLLLVVRVCRTCDDADCVWGFCDPRNPGDGSECVCLDGFEGDKCDIPSLRLTRDSDNSSSPACPCQNGATCMYNEISMGEAPCEASVDFCCVCPPGFTGDLCSALGKRMAIWLEIIPLCMYHKAAVIQVTDMS